MPVTKYCSRGKFTPVHGLLAMITVALLLLSNTRAAMPVEWYLLFNEGRVIAVFACVGT